MIKYLSCFLLLFLFHDAIAQDYSRAKIYTTQDGLKTLSDLGIAVDHGSHKPGHFFVSDFSKEELTRIENSGFEFEILIADVQKFYVDQNINPEPVTKNPICAPGIGSPGFNPITPSNFQLGTMGGFYKYQEMLDNLDLMQQIYPTLISFKAPIDTFLTIENRPVFWVRISDNPTIHEAGEKEILYSAVHHAREPNSMTELIYYMWYLLENYASSDEIQHLVENCEMYFVPCVNPDGYIYNETTNANGGGMHRKNRRNVGTSNMGVDLNRNYSYGWGTTGVSFNVDAETYPGTGPFSEAETQAIKWFCENHEFKLAFNAHTYSDLLLFPIGTTANEFAVDHNYFNRFTSYMVQYNGFTNMKSSGLYPASGDSDDYMYKMDLNVKPRILAMTPEVGTVGGFWPPITQIENISRGMVFPNLILAHISHRYLIVKDLDPSSIPTSTGVFNHEAERIGMDTGVVVVQIQPLQNVASIGAPISYDLAQITPVQGTFAYTLNTGIQFGDTVKYVLETVYPTWTKRDTITKLFGTLPVLVFDDASTTGQWIGNWTTETHTVHSPSQAYSDSETGSSASNYGNNTTKTFEYSIPVSLVNANDAMVSFFAKWEIEADYDYCQFQVSTDDGVSWIGQCGNYTVPGTSGSGSVQPNGQPVYEGSRDWVREEISLSDYLGQTIKVRFILRSDGGVNMDGFYFDDFTISASQGSFGLAENELNYKVFPNPAKDYLFISSNEWLTNAEYSLTDLKGKIQLKGSITEIANEYKISMNSLSEGIYMLSIHHANGKTSAPKKVVLLK
jgi:carboxypeptidase T